MSVYRFDDGKLDFNYYSTDPPVFTITVRPRDGYRGAFAKAEFRAPHDTSALCELVAWGETEAEALAQLLRELERYKGEVK